MDLAPARLHLATAATILFVSGVASPAMADPCDELARSLSQQIDTNSKLDTLSSSLSDILTQVSLLASGDAASA